MSKTTLVDRIMEYVFMVDDHGIIDGNREQHGRVQLLHNPEQIERILIEEKLYSSRPCLLCGTRRTRYAKLKGGFQQICDACRELCDKNGLLEAERQIIGLGEREAPTELSERAR